MNIWNRWINFATHPIRSGLLVGIGGGVLLVCACTLLALLMIAQEKVTGGVGGAGGIIGFILVPIVVLAGAPWSLYIFSNMDGTMALVWAIVIGLGLNSLLIGLIIGLVAKCRNARKRTDDEFRFS